MHEIPINELTSYHNNLYLNRLHNFLKYHNCLIPKYLKIVLQRKTNNKIKQLLLIVFFFTF